MLLILLRLFNNGSQTIQEILDGLHEKLGEECPWEENELGIELNELVNASDYVLLENGKYIITSSGINVLKTSRGLEFIFKVMSWVDQLRAAGRI